MRSFVIQSFKGGFSDWEDKGIGGAFKPGTQNCDIRKTVDSLSCQQALSDDLASGGIMDALCNFIVPASDGNLYFFLANGKIIKRTSGGVYSLVTTDADGAIIGAAEWVNNAGKAYLYWATSTKLNRKEIPGLANWTDVNADGGWPKVNLTASTWHTMKQVVGTLQICNKNTMAMVGYDDSYSNNSLELIPGNEAITVIERNRAAIIGCKRIDGLQQASLFMWDTMSLSWNDKQVLPYTGVSAMLDTEYPILQVDTDGQLFFSDMTNSMPITRIPGGGYVMPDAIENDSGMALIGVSSAASGYQGVYSYGRKRKNAQPVLNLEYALACDQIGSVKKSGGNIFIAYKSGTAYGVKKVNTGAKAVATYISLDLKAPINLRYEPTFSTLRLITAPMPAGSSITAWRRINKTGSFTQAKMEGAVATFNTTNAQEAIFNIGDKGKVFELKLILTPNGNNAPEVYRAEVYFE